MVEMEMYSELEKSGKLMLITDHLSKFVGLCCVFARQLWASEMKGLQL